MEWSYDKNRNYTQELNEAVAAGGYRKAAILEAQRNAKVRGENMGDKYKITSNYASYLPHQEQINSGMDQLAEKKEWSYDPSQDQAWQAARKQYLREADRGTRDTMATYAGMTGGVPSTAAVAAGQQAGNYYRAQLMDRLPEYMQNDYNRWANNRDMDRADLQALAALDQQQANYSLTLQQQQAAQEQQRFQNAMQRWETLGYADQAVADALGVPVGTSTQSAAYQQWQQEFQQQQFDWDKQSDLWNRDFKQQQFDWDKESELWQRQYTEKQAAISTAMQRWETLGYADQAVADALGVPVGTSTQSAAYQQWQQKQSEQDGAYDRVMTWLKMGLMPTDAELQAAGISREQAQRYIDQVQQVYVGSHGSGGGSYSRGSGSGNGDTGGSGNTVNGSGSGSGSNAFANMLDNTREATGQYMTKSAARIGIFTAYYAKNKNAAEQILDQIDGHISDAEMEELVALYSKLFGKPPVTGHLPQPEPM